MRCLPFGRHFGASEVSRFANHINMVHFRRQSLTRTHLDRVRLIRWCVTGLVWVFLSVVPSLLSFPHGSTHASLAQHNQQCGGEADVLVRAVDAGGDRNLSTRGWCGAMSRRSCTNRILCNLNCSNNRGRCYWNSP